MTVPSSSSALATEWAVLTAARVKGELATIPVLKHELGDVHLGLDVTGSRHLLLPTRLSARTTDDAVAALTDSVRSLRVGDTTEALLDVTCHDATLFDVFDDLVLDLLDGLADAADPGASALEALYRWRRIFRSVSASFGKTARYGLFAELTLLRDLVGRVGPEAVKAWAGPDRAPHDFELRSACLEVKGTGVASPSITIHGLRQLEEDGCPLFLVVLTLEESVEGESISDLVERIEATAGRGTLLEGLARYGFRAGVSPDEPLRVVDAFGWRVGPGTPRIVSNAVSGDIAAIDRVEYTIELAALLKSGTMALQEVLEGVTE